MFQCGKKNKYFHTSIMGHGSRGSRPLDKEILPVVGQEMSSRQSYRKGLAADRVTLQHG